MTDDAGQKESRTLPGGEIVHLVKDPGWKAGLSEAEGAAVEGIREGEAILA